MNDGQEGGPAGEPDPLPTAFARVREARSVKQITLAHQTGISLRTIQRIEKGEIANPGIRTLAALAKALGVELAEICEPEWLTGSSPGR